MGGFRGEEKLTRFPLFSMFGNTAQFHCIHAQAQVEFETITIFMSFEIRSMFTNTI